MLNSYKLWPNQWLYVAAFVACMDIAMTVRKFYIVNVICSGAFSLIFAYILVTLYEIYFYRRKFIQDVDKKAVLVTGCDRGFGLIFAQKLSKMGLVVYATVLDTKSEGARALTTQRNVVVARLDVTDQSNIDEVVEFVKSDLKKRDCTFWGLVNNAGVIEYGTAEFAPMDHFQKVIDVNLFGVLRMCKSFMPLLRDAGGGRIVNIGSQSRLVTLPGSIAYSMGKSALAAFSNGLRLEMKPWNISVHVIEPSFYEPASDVEDYRNRLKDICLEMWHRAPAELKLAYGEAYRDDFLETSKNFVLKFSKRGEDLVEVVDDVAHAVAGTDPNDRYVPATDIKFISAIINILPQELIDYFFTPKVKTLPAGVKSADKKEP